MSRKAKRLRQRLAQRELVIKGALHDVMALLHENDRINVQLAGVQRELNRWKPRTEIFDSPENEALGIRVLISRIALKHAASPSVIVEAALEDVRQRLVDDSEGRMKLIGLGFKARSGKDLAASMLGMRGYQPIAFAGALKRAAGELFGLSEAQLHGDQKEIADPFWGLTPRNLLQRLGTEAMRREFGDDFWIRVLKRYVDDQIAHGAKRFVVTDVRFKNEAEAIKAWGGVVVRVDRPGAGAKGGVASHASEVELDTWAGWDRVLKNDGSIEDLEARVIELEASL